MSRLDVQAAKMAETLQGKKLFGEIPSLTGVQNKPQRLTDQIDLIKEKAYQDGYQAGFENGNRTGIAEGRKAGFEVALNEAKAQRNLEATQFFEDWQSMRDEFQQAVLGWYEKSEEAMTQLAMDVVHKVLATELEINHQAALGICKEVLANVTHAKQARVYINPNDYAMFESHREELVRHSRELRSIEIVEDSKVRSGVLVETDSGLIDASVETRLELIENEFNQAA